MRFLLLQFARTANDEHQAFM